MMMERFSPVLDPVDTDSGGTRMLHIAWVHDDKVAFCGYALPQWIEGLDTKGPTSAVDCIVCAEIARERGVL